LNADAFWIAINRMVDTAIDFIGWNVESVETSFDLIDERIDDRLEMMAFASHLQFLGKSFIIVGVMTHDIEYALTPN
jgi:hypothetical protein